MYEMKPAQRVSSVSAVTGPAPVGLQQLPAAAIPLPIPLARHAQYVARTHLNLPYKGADGKTGDKSIPRFIHGNQHACRTAILGLININLLLTIGNKAASKLSKNDIEMTLIACFFHDSGRENDGKDLPEWEKKSAENCYNYLTKELKQSPEIARRFAEAIANKDYQVGKSTSYHSSATDSSGKLIWRELTGADLPKEKDIVASIIQSADCLDIQRATHYFDATKLDLYQMYGSYEAVLEAISELRMEVKGLVKLQGDSYLDRVDTRKMLKKKYELSADCYQQTVADLGRIWPKNGVDQQSPRQLVFPLLSALYNNGVPFSQQQVPQNRAYIQDICYHKGAFEAQSSLMKLMYHNRLFVRMVHNPFLEKIRKSDKDPTKEKKPELAGALESRKIGRDPENNQRGKDGNRNRSATWLVQGAFTFSRVGFAFEPKESSVHNVALTNKCSGFGKRKDVDTKSSSAGIGADLARILRLMKLGGGCSYATTPTGQVTKLSLHNEATCDVKKADLRAIIYTNDFSACYSKPGFYEKAKIEAIGLQRLYFLETRNLLPIYEYYPSYNFLQPVTYDDPAVIKLWCQLIDKYLAQYSHSSKYQDTFFNCCECSLDDLKIYAMHTGHKMVGSERLFPADCCYLEPIKKTINAQLEKIRVQHFFKMLTYLLDNAEEVTIQSGFSKRIFALMKTKFAAEEVRAQITSVDLLIDILKLLQETDRTVFLQEVVGPAQIVRLIANGESLRTIMQMLPKPSQPQLLQQVLSAPDSKVQVQLVPHRGDTEMKFIGGRFGLLASGYGEVTGRLLGATPVKRNVINLDTQIPFDFTGCNLVNQNFSSSGDLTQWNFTRAKLQNASFEFTTIDLSKFNGADLTGAKFFGADLISKTDFSKVDFASMKFTDAFATKLINDLSQACASYKENQPHHHSGYEQKVLTDCTHPKALGLFAEPIIKSLALAVAEQLKNNPTSISPDTMSALNELVAPVQQAKLLVIAAPLVSCRSTVLLRPIPVRFGR